MAQVVRPRLVVGFTLASFRRIKQEGDLICSSCFDSVLCSPFPSLCEIPAAKHWGPHYTRKYKNTVRTNLFCKTSEVEPAGVSPNTTHSSASYYRLDVPQPAREPDKWLNMSDCSALNEWRTNPPKVVATVCERPRQLLEQHFCDGTASKNQHFRSHHAGDKCTLHRTCSRRSASVGVAMFNRDVWCRRAAWSAQQLSIIWAVSVGLHQ
jgi:hypothetical protein